MHRMGQNWGLNYDSVIFFLSRMRFQRHCVPRTNAQCVWPDSFAKCGGWRRSKWVSFINSQVIHVIFDAMKTFSQQFFAQSGKTIKRIERNIIVEQTYVALTLLRVFLIHVPEKSVEGSFPLLGERRRVECGLLAVYQLDEQKFSQGVRVFEHRWTRKAWAKQRNIFVAVDGHAPSFAVSFGRHHGKYIYLHSWMRYVCERINFDRVRRYEQEKKLRNVDVKDSRVNWLLMQFGLKVSMASGSSV